MYCPRCGAQNIEEAKFCRLCGAAFRPPSKPSQSMTIPPDYGRAFRPLFMGIGVLLVVLISVSSHTGFFWWLMFPAFSLMSKGLRRLNQMKQVQIDNAFPQHTRMLRNNSPQEIKTASYDDVRARQTGEMMPPSVTESTTRLLER